jgi:hypothetical protein
LKGEVEWIAGSFYLSLAKIEAVAAEDAEAIYGLAYLRGGFRVLIDAPGEDAAEVVALGTEAGIPAFARLLAAVSSACVRARRPVYAA